MFPIQTCFAGTPFSSLNQQKKNQYQFDVPAQNVNLRSFRRPERFLELLDRMEMGANLDGSRTNITCPDHLESA